MRRIGTCILLYPYSFLTFLKLLISPNEGATFINFNVDLIYLRLIIAHRPALLVGFGEIVKRLRQSLAVKLVRKRKAFFIIYQGIFVGTVDF